MKTIKVISVLTVLVVLIGLPISAEQLTYRDIAIANRLFKEGWNYAETGKYEDAIKAYCKGLKIDPDNTTAYYNLGIAYGHLERWEDAASVYERLISIKPDDSEAHYNLCLIYIVLNNLKGAEEECQVLREKAPVYAVELDEIIFAS